MYIIFAILLFSFLIFIHELGHFVTAKLSGIRVNEFALFMGPAIFQKTVGETTYSLRCLPIGGYCAMEGEDGDSDDPRSFTQAAWWKRLIVLLAGATMNLIAGVLIFAVLYAPMEYALTNEIVSIEPWSTLGGESGLQTGDTLLEIDGRKVYVSMDMSMLVQAYPGTSHTVTVERNGSRLTLTNQTLQRQQVADEDGNVQELFGVTFGSKNNNGWSGIGYALRLTASTLRSVPLTFRMLFTGLASFKDVGSVVQIVKIASDTGNASSTVSGGLQNVLYLFAIVAINLAVMNLLPIPALDGGRAVSLLLTTAAEAVTHKKIDPKYEAWIHSVGMILLLGLMVLVTFKDIFSIFRG